MNSITPTIFDKLPQELSITIFRYLQFKELEQLSLTSQKTCRWMKQYISSIIYVQLPYFSLEKKISLFKSTLLNLPTDPLYYETLIKSLMNVPEISSPAVLGETLYNAIKKKNKFITLQIISSPIAISPIALVEAIQIAAKVKQPNIVKIILDSSREIDYALLVEILHKSIRDRDEELMDIILASTRKFRRTDIVDAMFLAEDMHNNALVEKIGKKLDP